MSKLFKGIQLILSQGHKVNAEEHLRDKLVALYFSAGWCSSSREFTPKLKSFYEKLKAADKNFEVVSVSHDRSEESLVKTYEKYHGNWAYLPFGSPQITECVEKYKVLTIPSMKVIKPDGSVISSNARTEVENKGENAEGLFNKWLKLFNDQKGS